MTEAEIQKIVTAARDLLLKMDNLTTREFERGEECTECEALRQALGAAG